MDIGTVALAGKPRRNRRAAGDLFCCAGACIPCKRCHRVVQLTDNVDVLTIWMEGQMPRTAASLEGNRFVHVWD